MDDQSYKRIFGFAEMVADLLRHLAPPHLSTRLDFASLEKVSSEHVSDHLLRRLGDAVWRLRIRPHQEAGVDASGAAARQPLGMASAPEESQHVSSAAVRRRRAEGHTAWAYLALEFQSDVEVDMALRMCTYVTLTLEGLRRSRTSAADRAAGPFLPDLTAVVVYNGDRPWSAPLALSERFAPADPWFTETRPGQRYRLIDLQRLERDDATGARLVAGLAGVERSRSLAELAAARTALKERLRSVANADLVRAFADWVNHLAGRIAPEKAQEAASTFWETDMTLEKRVAEWPKQWKQEGLEEGLEMGRELGLAAGMAHERTMLAHMATARFGAETGAKLSAALDAVDDPERLTRVGEAVVRSGSPAELLASVDDA